MKRRVLFQIDQYSAEALIVAYLCRYGRYRQLIEFNVKPHTYIAARIFSTVWAEKLGKPNIDEVLTSPIPKLQSVSYWPELSRVIRDDADRYYCGKQTGLSSNYDIKAPTFQLQMLKNTKGKVFFPLKECDRFLTIYKHELFPEIPEWHSNIQNHFRTNRTLKNLFGFPRIFSGPWGEDLFKKGYAFVPQSTVGTLTNIAITETQKLIEDGVAPDGVDLLQNGHDSMLGQCYEEDITKVETLFRPLLEKELSNSRGEKFKMKTEMEVGLNWGPATKENPDGMRGLEQWLKEN